VRIRTDAKRLCSCFSVLLSSLSSFVPNKYYLYYIFKEAATGSNQWRSSTDEALANYFVRVLKDETDIDSTKVDDLFLKM